jgi:Microcystin-dependent protein
MDEPILGMIKLFPYQFVPMDWLECNGMTLQIAQNTALYSLLGIQFGGDGRTTFKLPDLRNALPYPSATGGKAYVYCIASAGLYPERS